MILSILIIFTLLMIAIAGVLYVSIIHYNLKNELEEKDWMENSEYDYGHNINYNEENN